MEFRDLLEKVVANAMSYGKEFNITIDESFVFAKMIEEIGELAQAVLIQQRKSRPIKFVPDLEARAEIAKELADVVGFAMVYGHLLGIDIEAALTEKWINGGSAARMNSIQE